MVRARLFGVTLMVAALSSSFASDVDADCAHPPVPLPGLSGVPVWLPSPLWTPPTPSWRGQLNDPRWANGPVEFFQNQTGGGFADQYDAQYRVVYAPSSISVSIQVRIDPNNIDGTDTVYFGITQPGTSVAHLFAIQPDNGTPPVSDPTGTVPHDTMFPRPNSNATIKYYKTLNTAVTTSWCELYPVSTPATGTGPCGAALSAPPSWLQNVATWTSSPGVTWAVTLQIDASAIGAAAQPVQMVFGSTIELSSPPAATVMNLTTASQSGTLIGTTPVNAAVTGTWTQFDPLGSACPAGISISPSTVGVWDTATSTLTNAVDTYPAATVPCPSCTNQFRVEAQNVPLAGSAGHPGAFAVRTRIRVADWGSTIADPNAPWDDFGIHADVFAQPQGFFTGDAHWAWTQAAGSSTANIDYTCTVQSGNRYCPFLASATRHQCMLVEIGVDPSATASGAPGWNVQTAAVYRNMEFGTASTLSEPATITLRGLKKVTGGDVDRDVYLYVETKNMPEHGGRAMELPHKEMATARAYAMRPPPVPRPVRQIVGGDAGAAAPSIDILQLPLLVGDQALAEVYPTYRVFPYYDSGKTVTVNGQARKVLVSMAPFGFYVDHSGSFFGFKTALEFLDASAREIAPHFYVVHVPSEGTFHVRTTITAEEKPAEGPQPPPVNRCNCSLVGAGGWSPLAFGFGGLAALALVLRSRRRNRERSSGKRR